MSTGLHLACLSPCHGLLHLEVARSDLGPGVPFLPPGFRVTLAQLPSCYCLLDVYCMYSGDTFARDVPLLLSL